MTRDESGNALLKVIEDHRDRDWGSNERNHQWPELTRRIRIAVWSRNETELASLDRELRWFMSPAFVLSERLRRIIERQKDRDWQRTSDNETWKGLVSRAATAIARKDRLEISEIGRKMVAFFRKRNEHLLADQLEKAAK